MLYTSGRRYEYVIGFGDPRHRHSWMNRQTRRREVSGCGRETTLTELLADGAKNYSSGVHVPEDGVSVGLPQGGATTWLRPRKRDGDEWG